MAKKETKKEEKEVIKEVVDNTKEEVTKAPKGKEPKGDITKVKAKMTKEPIVVDKPDVIKIDMSKPKEEAVVEDTAVEEQAPIVEITEEEKVEEVTKKVTEAIDVAEKTGTDLPESITKLMDFMSDTGGDLNDYVKLNKDYSEMDNQTLLEEYYKQTKPHLDNDEISFLMEDSFSFDEEVDEDRDIKKKKIALKEQVANAKSHLDGQKSKYYEEIKAGSKLTKDQQKAVEVETTQKVVQEQQTKFQEKTNQVFNDQFKGFEYGVGDKKFRYNVQDVDKVRNTQIDIDNFIGKFLDEDGKMSNESEYHKSLYTAMNADSIANHFYEQGKADAMKNSVANSKNVDMTPRQELNEPQQGGPKVRVIGDDGPSFKFKIKNKN